MYRSLVKPQGKTHGQAHSAFIAAGKEYELLIFPDERHMRRGLRDRIYLIAPSTLTTVGVLAEALSCFVGRAVLYQLLSADVLDHEHDFKKNIFDEQPVGVFGHNSLSRWLIHGALASLLLLTTSEAAEVAWHHLHELALDVTSSSTSAFARAHGKSVFEFVANDNGFAGGIMDHILDPHQKAPLDPEKELLASQGLNVNLKCLPAIKFAAVIEAYK
ncbi:hypothetical protein SELMODRAFT_430483 [Selaginella moellendorffii]|uniref:Uncharacterized protein n=1 Tax=Selaginella moellendorffii TaxID=88036 RepID=D8T9K0_SELML|nr:hypothetical protein SELMODRAFT_430483 [Selaginella moellendorffii]